MNNQNHKDAFEQFLTDETNKHEMFASDAVWTNINKQVQTRKRWPALTIIAFLIVVSLSVVTALNYPPDNILAKIKYNESLQLERQQQQAAIIASKSKDDNFEDRISSEKITAKTFAAIEQQLTVLAAIPAEDEKVEEPKPKATPKPSNLVVAKTIITPAEQLPFTKIERLPAVEILPIDDVAATNNKPEKTVTETENTKDATDNIYKDFYASRLAKKHSAKPIRWTYDIYITPSQSFRNLEDDKERDQYATTSIPNATATAPTASLSNTVKHKPALGLEVGVTIGYNLTNRLKFKAGVQFNIRQYYIDAYQTFGIATVAIVQNNRLDSLSFYSRFGSAGSSYAETKLDNRLYQLSIPLSLQWDALQMNRFGISVGASVQPTFTLNKSIYLISTDYKYYANGESFFRKWNVNTALDLNFSYKLRDAKIYFGPQVRYQHLPTYNDAYPIKEYRLDYGIKVGIIKSF
ncbi:MAG: outer membrane beta-barrel protein [Pedobacter sp.]|nr:outer membrane beta-barrel protein [Chitinophagaceae bacterium]